MTSTLIAIASLVIIFGVTFILLHVNNRQYKMARIDRKYEERRAAREKDYEEKRAARENAYAARSKQIDDAYNVRIWLINQGVDHDSYDALSDDEVIGAHKLLTSVTKKGGVLIPALRRRVEPEA